MGNYDGSHLGRHNGKSESLIQTAANLLEHCILVSSGTSKRAKGLLQGENTVGSVIDTPFTVIGNSFFKAEQATSMAKAYIAENSSSIVVTFRGSGVKSKDGSIDAKKTLKNALADINLPLIKDRKFPGKVHKGISSEYMQLRTELLERFGQTNYNKKRTVYITGFSLGAGLATLCAYDLATEFDINPHVYLFAQPAAGDHDFARQFERKITTVFRFAHEKDVVSQIPHCLVCSYKAPGSKLLVFDSNGKQVHHNKVTVRIKADRTAALIALGKRLRRAALLTVVTKVIHTFVTHHKPDYYKARLARLHRNYNNNISSNSSMQQTAEKQYQECQQHCLDL